MRPGRARTTFQEQSRCAASGRAGEPNDRPIPRGEVATAYERNFMRLEFNRASLDEGRIRRPIYIDRWSDQYHDAAAQLIATASRQRGLSRGPSKLELRCMPCERSSSGLIA